MKLVSSGRPLQNGSPHPPRPKILFVTTGALYPIVTGRQLRTHSFVEALARDNDLYLVHQYWDRGHDAHEFLKYFRAAQGVPAAPIPSARKPSLARRFARLGPRVYRYLSLTSWQFQSRNPAFEQAIVDIAEREGIDIVFGRYMDVARDLIRVRARLKARVIVDLDDIEPIKIARRLRTAERFGTRKYFSLMLNNWFYIRNHRRLRALDAVAVCSARDAAYVREKKWCRNVHVVPNTIHVRHYATLPPFGTPLLKAKTLLCCGHLGYRPNVDGLKWFLDHVWPTIVGKEPAAKLVMVGKNPDASLKKYVDEQRVFLYGDVESVLPYYENISAAIVPLHVGGGTRIKILEALAARRPVVSTTVGAEGLGVTARRDCLVADSPVEFAQACLEILEDAALAQRLVEEGYRLVNANYDFPVVAEVIQGVFRSHESVTSAGRHSPRLPSRPG